jgi:hypothetical protein
VVIDGEEAGYAPATLADVSAAEHLVRFEFDDGRSLEETVVVRAGGTARITVSFGGEVPSYWFWTTAAAALALGAGAAATGTYGTVLWNEFNDPATSRDRMEEIQPTGRTLMLTTDVLASVAGAFALTAGVLAFFTDFGGGPEADIAYDVGAPAPESSPAGPDLPSFPADVVSAP